MFSDMRNTKHSEASGPIGKRRAIEMKNSWGKRLAVALALVLVIGLCAACALAETISGTCGEGLTWTLDDDTATLTISGKGAMTDYDGDTEYAPWSDETVTTVIVESGVTTVGAYAFYGNDISEIELPSTLTAIGSHAFHGSKKLKSFSVPDGVTTIGRSAFGSCSQMTSIDLPGTLTSIGDKAFDRCSDLADVYFMGTEEEWAAVSIGKDNTYLTNAEWHQLWSIALEWKIANGRLTISGSGAMLEHAESAEVMPWYDQREDFTEILIGSGVRNVGDYAFYGCGNVTAITIGAKVSNIGDYAFYGCSKAESVHFNGQKVESIGGYAFSRCDRLTQFSVPSGVTSIGGYAFTQCAALEEIIVPRSVTAIGDDAFYAHDYVISEEGLAGVTISCFCDSYTRTWCDQNHYLTDLQHGQEVSYDVPATCTTAALTGGTQCAACGDILQQPTATGKPTGHHLADGACETCGKTFDTTGMTVLTLPASLEQINANAFRGASEQGVVIPDGCRSVGAGAFAGCDDLQYVFLPEGLTLPEDAVGGATVELIYR